jgi:NADPH-dependent curcumin reductase CurA
MVTAMNAKKFVFSKRFHGLPQHDNFSLEVEELPELKAGGLKIEGAMYVFWLIHVFGLIHRCSL